MMSKQQNQLLGQQTVAIEVVEQRKENHNVKLPFVPNIQQTKGRTVAIVCVTVINKELEDLMKPEEVNPYRIFHFGQLQIQQLGHGIAFMIEQALKVLEDTGFSQVVGGKLPAGLWVISLL